MIYPGDLYVTAYTTATIHNSSFMSLGPKNWDWCETEKHVRIPNPGFMFVISVPEQNLFGRDSLAAQPLYVIIPQMTGWTVSVTR